MLNRIERRIRMSGALVLVALILEMAGMLWKHPLSFTIVHLLSLTLFVIAIVIYLLSLLPENSSDEA